MTEAPDEIRLSADKARLTLVYGDADHALSAEYLRVETPSAEARGHAPSQARTVYGKSDVRIAGLEPVGRYAIKIVFDDGHDSGLYSWSLLRDLIDERDARWTAYLDRLKAEGLSRG